ncbi:DUF1707 SHOCT-like domain-containing protein [Spirillospora sp. CA-294931]|uniref:DUF1707 SHOCT-like domain-containing protein n=1 Tax=Spirillospora sp. CA-294931 TaxID=3240042 RepID=UPI003D8B22FE
MTGSVEPDRPELRASHQERDQVVERLRVAAGDGRLAPEELDERLEIALTARTQGELEALLRDLPDVPSSAPASKDLVRLEARGSHLERTGSWAVPRRLEAEVRHGNAVIDLTEAVVSHPVLELDVAVEHGNLQLIVPPEVEVDVDDVAAHNGVVSRRDRRVPGTTVSLRVSVSGTVSHGAVLIRGPRRRLVDRLLRRP